MKKNNKNRNQVDEFGVGRCKTVSQADSLTSSGLWPNIKQFNASLGLIEVEWSQLMVRSTQPLPIFKLLSHLVLYLKKSLFPVLEKRKDDKPWLASVAQYKEKKKDNKLMNDKTKEL